MNATNMNLTEVHLGGDYDSAFENDSETEKRRSKRNDLARNAVASSAKKPGKEFFTEEWSKEEGRKQRYHLLSLDSYSRHKKLINEYFLCYPGSTALLRRDRSKDKTETDVLKENHKFLWDDEEIPPTWEQRLAKKYYDKLFKEYCIADLSRYKENKVAMRWRTEQELLQGRGQFCCGNKHCSEKEGLRSWEVNFAYCEKGQKNNALVKLRLCTDCSYKLNYHHKKKELKQARKISIPDSEKSKPKKRKHEDDEIATTNESTTDVGSCSSDASKSENKEQTEIWKQPVKVLEDKSQEEEFDDYLADMLL